MDREKEIRQRITELLHSQLLAVLSTHTHGQPYASLIAFAETQDLCDILFATTRATRKFANLQADSRSAFLIDSRSNMVDDFHEASAVTAIGLVKEIQADERPEYLPIYLAKHPHLEEFVHAPSTALLKVRVSKYILVSRFQEVMELHL